MRLSACILFTVAAVFSANAFAADDSNVELQKTVEKAIKAVDAEKAKKQLEFEAKLNSELKLVAKAWVEMAKNNKKEELNRLIHNDWSDMTKYISPMPYDYYLRDFGYQVVRSDISKTGSITIPYAGYIKLIETQYIERYHSSEASSIEPFLHTVTRPITLVLEQKDNKFKIINIEYGPMTLEPGWRK